MCVVTMHRLARMRGATKGGRDAHLSAHAAGKLFQYILEQTNRSGSRSALLGNSRKTTDGVSRAHLVDDIQPYTCPLDDCLQPSQFFTTVEALQAHLERSHTEILCWRCLLCNTAPDYSSDQDLERHIRDSHCAIVRPEDIASITTISAVMHIRLPQQCPICNEASSSPEFLTTPFFTHLMDCIHQFSLLSLPWNDRNPVASHGDIAVDQGGRIDDWLTGLLLAGELGLSRLGKSDHPSLREACIEDPFVFKTPSGIADRSTAGIALEIPTSQYFQDDSVFDDHQASKDDLSSFDNSIQENSVEEGLVATSSVLTDRLAENEHPMPASVAIGAQGGSTQENTTQQEESSDEDMATVPEHDYVVIDPHKFELARRKLITSLMELMENQAGPLKKFCAPTTPERVFSQRLNRDCLTDICECFEITDIHQSHHELQQALLDAVGCSSSWDLSLSRVFAILLVSFEDPTSIVWPKFLDLCLETSRLRQIHEHQHVSAEPLTNPNDRRALIPSLLADEHLPLTSTQFHCYFGHEPESAARFIINQYTFCPIVLAWKGRVTYTSPREQLCPMPFTQENIYLGAGPFSCVYRVKIHEDLLQVGQRFVPATMEKPAVYACKIYRFDDEDHDGWIADISDLMQGITQVKTIMPALAVLTLPKEINFFYELAVCNLSEYMHDPTHMTADFGPRCISYRAHRASQSDHWCKDVIRKVLGLGDGIQFLHDKVSDPSTLEHLAIYSLDLEPSSILVMRSSHEEVFKIASFRWHMRVATSRHGVRRSTRIPTPRDRGHTESTVSITAIDYICAAPECMIKNGRITSKVDVWAFGCVLSMIMAWLYSDSGLVELERARATGCRAASSKPCDQFFIRHRRTDAIMEGDACGELEDLHGTPVETIFTPNMEIFSFFDNCVQVSSAKGDMQRAKLFRDINNILRTQALVPALPSVSSGTNHDQSKAVGTVRGSMRDVVGALAQAYVAFCSQLPSELPLPPSHVLPRAETSSNQHP